MDYYQYSSARTTPTYPFYSNYSDQSTQRYTDSYGRVTATHPSSSPFRTTTITTNSPSTPIARARVQQFSSYRPTTSNASNSTYDTPRSYYDQLTSGYASDTNELRRSSISIRPTSANARPFIQPLQPKVTVQTEQNYFSDSECVTSGPRYYKISRQVNTVRRPSNIVLPIRSMTSKAYEPYIPSPEQPKPPPQQQPFDVYRYQQERERQEQLQRQAAASRYNPPPKLSFPIQTTNNHEIGAELFKSPIANSSRLCSSSLTIRSFFFVQKNAMQIRVFSKQLITLIQQLTNRRKWHIKSQLFSKVVIPRKKVQQNSKNNVNEPKNTRSSPTQLTTATIDHYVLYKRMIRHRIHLINNQLITIHRIYLIV